MFSIINPPSNTYIPGCVGQVSPGMELKIIDIQTKKSLPANQTGEICVRGPMMFKGYLNNPEATANTIDSDDWLHSGDVGHYNEDGNLFITDRIKEMIKYRMYTLFPVEVEACLLEHEAIAEAVVVGVKHKRDGEWPRAYVKLKDNQEVKNISPEDIEKYVAGKTTIRK